MVDWISEQLERVPVWMLFLGIIAFFVVFYLLLSYFNIRADAFTLPLGIHKALTPLGITLLTAGGLVSGVALGLIRERFA